ncbi:hypothetical protein GCM10023074_09850 [Microbispora amethystogenes]|uniref:Uncharacterized protein n=1 Tax=Microbispora amethystogenes TaxID=1427754 RepID=A0ABQ4FIF0_9ACTN|nr:hypothetical protein Mam01_47490 [Microbispora amethystogenes]
MAALRLLRGPERPTAIFEASGLTDRETHVFTPLIRWDQPFSRGGDRLPDVMRVAQHSVPSHNKESP